MIRHERIEDYLNRLASGEPTPGGGATGALMAAQGAALVAMAARFSDREELAARCERIAVTALGLSDADESGFASVADAFAMPRDTEPERAERSRQIQQAIERAAEPPGAIVTVAADVVGVATELLEDYNQNVLSDVGAALGAERAALMAAVVTLETDLAPLKDPEVETRLRKDIDGAARLIDDVDALVTRVRRLIRGG
ncbi:MULTISPECIES: cyclodeaminase/cyclohydrolase family protein [Micrococcaceae]|uniref:cyclodeaminase/cyclohydrolase family protein n=2 Tax=Micrococcales TaxID=85006 RepID=UPI001616D00D|nr:MULTISPECIES: cyclodeaminase/cyclohydrolase family protein [Micrococcaceae]MBB5749986.1 formiminotetrahydrofolate cyclodeaminase [Micrococcus sp. TA1]HRO93157.1 cyclodeaminase/cyclohydrolase family protein [Citricoccus sp.]